MKTRTEYTCPLELTHDITKGKWKPLILWLLGKEAQSLSNLKKQIKGISQKVLIEQLQELITYGMVSKTTYEGYPLKVSYALLPRGSQMLQAIEIMQRIGIDMMLEDDREDMLKEQGFLS